MVVPGDAGGVENIGLESGSFVLKEAGTCIPDVRKKRQGLAKGSKRFDGLLKSAGMSGGRAAKELGGTSTTEDSAGHPGDAAAEDIALDEAPGTGFDAARDALFAALGLYVALVFEPGKKSVQL